MDRQPDDDEDDREERNQPADAGNERGDQHPLGWMPRPAARNAGVLGPALVVRHPLTGGATASATFRVSRRLCSAVSLNIVRPMLTIWMIPETTIIAPKIPRAM